MSLQRNDVRNKFLFNLDIYYVLSSRVNSSIKYDCKGNLYISQTVLLSLLLYNLIFIHFFFFLS